MAIDIGQLLNFAINAYSDWNKTSQGAGAKMKSPTTGSITEPYSNWNRSLSALGAGFGGIPQNQTMTDVDILRSIIGTTSYPSQNQPSYPQQQKKVMDLGNMLPPQGGKGGGGDVMSGISSILGILALLGI